MLPNSLLEKQHQLTSPLANIRVFTTVALGLRAKLPPWQEFLPLTADPLCLEMLNTDPGFPGFRL